MKTYALAAVTAALTIIAGQPAAAANFQEPAIVQSGTFAGARIRISLGGKEQDRKVHAGLTLAPTLRSQTTSGETRTRIGEGLELGFTGERPLTLSFAGRPVNRLLSRDRKTDDERRLGISTGGYVAIGVGVAALVGGFLVFDHYRDADAISD
jgi:hypothetical protein